MSLKDWVPKYIKKSINDLPKQIINADYWNSLWNLVIQQGDNNTEGLVHCKEDYANLNKKQEEIVESLKNKCDMPEGGDKASVLGYKPDNTLRWVRPQTSVSVETDETHGTRVFLNNNIVDKAGQVLGQGTSYVFPFATEDKPGLMTPDLYKQLNDTPNPKDLDSKYGYPSTANPNDMLFTRTADGSSRFWGRLKPHFGYDAGKVYLQLQGVSVDSDGVEHRPFVYSAVDLPNVSSEKAGVLNADDYKLLKQISEDYVSKDAILTICRYKGSVADEDALNDIDDPMVGDVYNILTKSSYGDAGTNVAYTGESWDALGTPFSISTLTDDEIDEICK